MATVRQFRQLNYSGWAKYGDRVRMAEYSLDGITHHSGSLEPGLYIVATPIGNLADITIRALKTLAGADLIACEDTRTTGKLLKHFGIATKMTPYHEHNADKAGAAIISMLQENQSVALVSDAGTPLISDPGYRLVAGAREKQVRIVPVPGPSAPLAALVASGLQTDRFMFAGFLPSKTAARKSRLRELADVNSTMIFFESPNRLLASLDDIIEIYGGERVGAVARELTKFHEEITSGSLLELRNAYDGRKVRGEIVIVIAPLQQDAQIDIDALLGELLTNMSVSRAAAEASKLSGKTKREMYQRALALRGE